MTSQLPEIQISKRAFDQVKGGSLWVFSNEFKTKVKGLESGTWVRFICGSDFVGFGYVNPHSLICGRIASRTPPQSILELIRIRIQEALAKRQSLPKQSRRVIFSESDNLPGFIVDQYEDVVVTSLTTAGADIAQEAFVEAVAAELNPQFLVLRGDSSVRHLEGVKNYKKVFRRSMGSATMNLVAEGLDRAQYPEECRALLEAEVVEGNVRYAADFVFGQKTGFFLDQRENRGFLGQISQGKSVLDLCCYSGGWGLAAMNGGAEAVSFVDQSAEALALVEKGISLNGFKKGQANLVTSDVFEFLKMNQNKYDIVVSDPPAFIKSKAKIGIGIKAYTDLNRAALRALKPGGVLLTCSCSFHLSEEEFEGLLKTALQKQGRVGEVIYRGRQGIDHPWILNRPESRYLKVLGIRVY
ncbi:MAG: class I SAM-dependent rRNA methyltransferase [Oligoflexia bacterium]|nr:class I SAM-dependent rRNA methyltransferase [Oligoflexia bacterium]